MKCPFCSHLEDKVIDSRLGKEGKSIRRRRECLSCKARFTTYEQVEEVFPMVVKKDGRREQFDRQKILMGVKKACEKRPISVEILEKLVDDVERIIQENSEREIPSSRIGELVVQKLHALDEIAYVRFASVYRQFKDINEFLKELTGLVNKKSN